MERIDDRRVRVGFREEMLLEACQVPCRQLGQRNNNNNAASERPLHDDGMAPWHLLCIALLLPDHALGWDGQWQKCTI